MTRDELLSLIRRIRTELPRVRYVVLSGGEVTLLRKDLLDALSLLTELGLRSRIVTNGHWARTDQDAERWVNDLVAAGLNELNLSTGDEHLEWVPIESVSRAAFYATQRSLLTVVTIEGQAAARFRADEFQQLPFIQQILVDEKLRTWLIMMTNVWMPFHSDVTIRADGDIPDTGGCDNIYSNFVVNPYGHLMSCCGLTMEYIPEMKVGHLSDTEPLQQIYSAQFAELLKLWIWLDGTHLIFELARQRSGKNVSCQSPHQCAMCAQIYQNPGLRPAVRELVEENAEQIIFRSLVKARLTGRIDEVGNFQPGSANS